MIVSAIWMVILIPLAYGDNIETMGVIHKDNPMTCIMIPPPEIQERFYDELFDLTIETIWGWQEEMTEYTNGTPYHDPNGWYLPIKAVEYKKHFDKEVWDFPECNIFIEFSRENTGQHIENKNALGYTQIDFSKSKHQWAYIRIYTDSIEEGGRINLCIGCDDEPKKSITISLETKPMPNDAIRKILRHEFAHALGIGHYIEDNKPENNIASLMYKKFNPFTIKSFDTIPITDKEMLRQIYNSDGFKGQNGIHYRNVNTVELIEGVMDNLKDKF